MATQWPTSSLLLIGMAAAFGIAAILYGAIRLRPSADERERQRRRLVDEQGRAIDGYVTDTDETTIFYRYAVRGVDYQTAQDVSTILPFLPAEPRRLLGPVAVKYLVRRPENSIVLSEHWCGLKAKAAGDLVD